MQTFSYPAAAPTERAERESRSRRPYFRNILLLLLLLLPLGIILKQCLGFNNTAYSIYGYTTNLDQFIHVVYIMRWIFTGFIDR